MKRILALLLAIVFCTLSVSVCADSDSITVSLDGVNCDRGGDQTVLYNVSGTKTGTNMWGYEITVTEGRVTAVGGNDSLVPDGDKSFVVSAHGSAMDALYAVTVGMLAEYDSTDKTVTFTLDENINITRIDLARNAALSARDKALAGCYIIADDAETRFAEIEIKYNALNGVASEEDANSLIKEYEILKTLYRDRAVSEYRGVWVNPTQKDYAEVESFVRKCVRAGINVISVETLFDCTTICPMPEGYYFEHNPYFEGFDVLGAYVEACHKYGIELHCWMHVYSVGDPASTNFSKSVAYKKPEWCLVDNNGEFLKGFLNPALPEVRSALLENYRYIIENYDIDAFELDCIRYSEVTTEQDFGYDSETVRRFKEKYPEYAETEISYNKSASYWSDWVVFRNYCVTELVRDARALIDEIAPDVLLTADVGSTTWDSYYSRYQDPFTWLDNGYLDIVRPMSYALDDYANVKEFFAHNGECLVVPALGTYLDGFTDETMLSQACGMVDIGCYGVAYFAEEQFFAKNCDKLLSETIYTRPSIAPALNGANTSVAELTRFIERIETALIRGYISYETKGDLEASAEAVTEILKNERASNSREALIRLYEKTESLEDGILKERLLKDINNAYSAVERKPDDEYCEYEIMDNSVPADAKDARVLTVDKIDSPHRGEDSVIITDPTRINDYNVKYAYVMLLRLEDSEKGLYTLVESCRNWGSFGGFSAPIESGMIVLSFHSNDVGSGAERRNLAQTVEIGSTLALWGIDVKTAEFNNLNSLVYVSKAIPSYKLDVNGDGKFNMFDYINVKNICLKGSADEALVSRADINGDGRLNMFDYITVKSEYFRQSAS